MHTMTLKNITNHEFDLKIIDWERPLFPDLYDEYKEIAGRDGRRHLPRELGNRTIRVQFFRVNRSTEEWFEVKKDIIAWLFTREEVEIKFDDEPDIYYIGKVTEADIPENYKPSTSFWITLTCHPLKYGQQIVTNETEFTYGGTYDKTPFKMTLENVTANELVVSVNGVEIKYTEPLENATVTIDSGELELRVNGELKVFEVEGYFSFLKPGQNVIDVNVDADITIEFMELFL